MKRPQITAIATNGSDVVFSWIPPTTSSRITSYIVDYTRDDSPRVRIEDVMTTSYRIKNAPAGIYSISVSSRTTKSQSAPSLPVRLHHVLVEEEPEPEPKTEPEPAPKPVVATDARETVSVPDRSAPTGLYVRALTDTAATVWWDASPLAKTWVIHMKSSKPGDKPGVLKVPGSHRSLDIDDLEVGTSYTFTLTCIYQDDTASTPSDKYIYTLAQRAPSKPMNLRMEKNQFLTWDAPSDTGGSTVTYSIKHDNGWIHNVTDTSFSMTALPLERPFTFTVFARNKYGESPPSPPFKYTFRYSGDVTPPSAPHGVTTVSKDGAISLRWNKPTRDGNSAVLRYTVSWESEIGGGTVDSLSTESTISGLRNDILYTIRILASNSIGSSEPTTVQCMPSKAPTSAPSDLKATKIDQLNVTLTWNAPKRIAAEAIDSYTIDMKSEKHYGTVSAIKDTSVKLALKRDQHYTFAVAACNGAGLGPFSNSTSYSTQT